MCTKMLNLRTHICMLLQIFSGSCIMSDESQLIGNCYNSNCSSWQIHTLLSDEFEVVFFFFTIVRGSEIDLFKIMYKRSLYFCAFSLCISVRLSQACGQSCHCMNSSCAVWKEWTLRTSALPSSLRQTQCPQKLHSEPPWTQVEAGSTRSHNGRSHV